MLSPSPRQLILRMTLSEPRCSFRILFFFRGDFPLCIIYPSFVQWKDTNFYFMDLYFPSDIYLWLVVIIVLPFDKT